MDIVYRNIRQRRKELGMSQQELADALGYKSRTTIAKIEAGRVDLARAKVIEFAKVLRTTPTELLGWDVEPVRTKRVPLLGTIACGEPILAIENIEGQVSMPDHINADYALRCKGDSMIGARINDGDIVYIHQQDDVENGEIAAVLIDDEVTLKRVYKTGQTVILQAENPAYPPRILTELSGTVRIIGKAVGFYSDLK